MQRTVTSANSSRRSRPNPQPSGSRSTRRNSGPSSATQAGALSGRFDALVQFPVRAGVQIDHRSLLQRTFRICSPSIECWRSWPCIKPTPHAGCGTTATSHYLVCKQRKWRAVRAFCSHWPRSSLRETAWTRGSALRSSGPLLRGSRSWSRTCCRSSTLAAWSV